MAHADGVSNWYLEGGVTFRVSVYARIVEVDRVAWVCYGTLPLFSNTEVGGARAVNSMAGILTESL